MNITVNGAGIDKAIIKHQNFKFVKEVEMEEYGVRITLYPYRHNYATTQVIYTKLVVDEMSIYDTLEEMSRALSDWIENETTECERIFAELTSI